MASKRDTTKALKQLVTNALASYDIGNLLQEVVQEQVFSLLKSKPVTRSRKRNSALNIAEDSLNSTTKDQFNDPSNVKRDQPLQGLTDNKVKLIIQGVLALGTLLKNGANIAPAKNSTATPNTLLQTQPPAITNNSAQLLPAPAAQPEEKKKDKTFFDQKQVFYLGGITDEGVEDLKDKMPKILEGVLNGIQDTIKNLKFPDIKVNTPRDPGADPGAGGGIFDRYKQGGILGLASDFLGKRKGTALGDISRNRKAAKLREMRSQRTPSSSAELKTVEEKPVRSAPSERTPVDQTGRDARAKEPRAERAARNAETGTTLKPAAVPEKELATTAGKGTEGAGIEGGKKTVAKRLGKSSLKQGGKGILKSGLKKIPGLGIIAGLGFGAQRALAGDWLGAAGEVASGAAGSIPGLGTAVSLGIDASLAARDIYKETKQSEVQDAQTSTLQPSETPMPFKEGDQNWKPVEQGKDKHPTPISADAGNKILDKIAGNTEKTNMSITSLAQAIIKLADNLGKSQSQQNIIVNGKKQQQSYPSASQVAAANIDPIRQIRAQFAI
jgi:hypothetical protein